MSKIPLVLLSIYFISMVQTMPAYADIAAHKHELHSDKERLKDGIYQPRDAHHRENAEHNVEFDHEAIIGNLKEAQEFDTLSPEESKKRLAALVHLMDLNKDEYVDRHELKAWILRSFKRLAEEESSERFEEIDQNNDEQISWREYLLDVYAMEDENFKREAVDVDNNEEEQKMIKDDKEMFIAADLNKDEQLNADEFVLFQNPEEHPEMFNVILKQTMREKDKNHDGKIDFQEYVLEAAENHDKEWLIAEKDRFDNEFDANSDGFLVGNEVLSWVVPSNEAVATDEVDHLFAHSDEDHDDRLSYYEIINNYETFVGSEATDYGDHLQNINHLVDEL